MLTSVQFIEHWVSMMSFSLSTVCPREVQHSFQKQKFTRTLQGSNVFHSNTYSKNAAKEKVFACQGELVDHESIDEVFKNYYFYLLLLFLYTFILKNYKGINDYVWN